MKFKDSKSLKHWKLPVNYNKLRWEERAEVRRQYIKEQDNLCYYCKTSLHENPPKYYNLNLRLFPKGFLENPIHLHHDHNTGLTIGAVHAYCNGVLWQYHGE